MPSRFCLNKSLLKFSAWKLITLKNVRYFCLLYSRETHQRVLVNLLSCKFFFYYNKQKTANKISYILLQQFEDQSEEDSKIFLHVFESVLHIDADCKKILNYKDKEIVYLLTKVAFLFGIKIFTVETCLCKKMFPVDFWTQDLFVVRQAQLPVWFI